MSSFCISLPVQDLFGLFQVDIGPPGDDQEVIYEEGIVLQDCPFKVTF
jgi:hypothetical protein